MGGVIGELFVCSSNSTISIFSSLAGGRGLAMRLSTFSTLGSFFGVFSGTRVAFQPERSNGCSPSSLVAELGLDAVSFTVSSSDVECSFSLGMEKVVGRAGDGVKSASSAVGGLTFSATIGTLGGVKLSLRYWSRLSGLVSSFIRLHGGPSSSLGR